MKFILFLTYCFLAFSCGIKGPPLPPIEETTIQQQKPLEPVNTTAAPAASSDTTKAKKKNK
ncbi:hypothetical protein K2P97_01735 [bacterium]|nr:hypothetical protein [bacterium]